ncbi:MAG: hypothetical protein M1832_006394 [Thelocarpon impressellum]|nr:MAG: hypothetical protein M1832_006394 [Thelocarpon impressellum]
MGERTKWKEEDGGKYGLQIPSHPDVFEKLIDVYNKTIATPNRQEDSDFAYDAVEWDLIDLDAGAAEAAMALE